MTGSEREYTHRDGRRQKEKWGQALRLPNLKHCRCGYVKRLDDLVTIGACGISGHFVNMEDEEDNEVGSLTWEDDDNVPVEKDEQDVIDAFLGQQTPTDHIIAVVHIQTEPVLSAESRAHAAAFHAAFRAKILPRFMPSDGKVRNWRPLVARTAVQRHLAQATRLTEALLSDGTLRSRLMPLGVTGSGGDGKGDQPTLRERVVMNNTSHTAVVSPVAYGIRSGTGALKLSATTPVAQHKKKEDDNDPNICVFVQQWSLYVSRAVAAFIETDIRHLCNDKRLSWRNVYEGWYNDAKTDDVAWFWQLTIERVSLALEQSIERYGGDHSVWQSCRPPRDVIEHVLCDAVIGLFPKELKQRFSKQIAQIRPLLMDPRCRHASLRSPELGVVELDMAQEQLCQHLCWALASVQYELQAANDERRRFVVGHPIRPVWKQLARVWKELPEWFRDAVSVQDIYFSAGGPGDNDNDNKVTSVCTDKDCIYVVQQRANGAILSIAECALSETAATTTGGSMFCKRWATWCQSFSKSRLSVADALSFKQRADNIQRINTESLFVMDLKCRYAERRRTGDGVYAVYDKLLPRCESTDIRLLCRYATRCMWSLTTPPNTVSSSLDAVLWRMFQMDERVRCIDSLPSVSSTLLDHPVFSTCKTVTKGVVEARYWFDHYAAIRYRNMDNKKAWRTFAIEIARLYDGRRNQPRDKAARSVAKDWIDTRYGCDAKVKLTPTLRDLFEHAPPTWWERQSQPGPPATKDARPQELFYTSGWAMRLVTLMCSRILELPLPTPVPELACDVVRRVFDLHSDTPPLAALRDKISSSSFSSDFVGSKRLKLA